MPSPSPNDTFGARGTIWTLALGLTLLGAGSPPPRSGDFVLAVFSENGTRLVTSSPPTEPARLRVYEARTGTLLKGFDVRGVGVPGAGVEDREALLATADARRVVVMTGSGSPAVLATETGAILGTVPSLASRTEIYGFGPTDDSLVLGLFDDSRARLAVWDYRGDRMIAEGSWPEDYAETAARPLMSPRGRWLAFGAGRYPVTYAVFATQGAPRAFPNGGGFIWGFAFSADEARLAVGGADDIEIRDLSTGRAHRTGRCPTAGNRRLTPRRFAPDGLRLIAEGEAGLLCVFDATTGVLIASGTSRNRRRSDEVKVSADASRAVVYRKGDDTFEIRDGRTARILTRIVPAPARAAHDRRYLISPDGSLLVSSDGDGSGAWDTTTGSRVFALRDP